MTEIEKKSSFKCLIRKIKYLSFAIITTGVVFKTNHWPGSTALIIAGGLTLSLVFIITAFGDPSNNSEEAIL
jgi:hypothetical protein